MQVIRQLALVIPHAREMLMAVFLLLDPVLNFCFFYHLLLNIEGHSVHHRNSARL